MPSARMPVSSTRRPEEGGLAGLDVRRSAERWRSRNSGGTTSSAISLPHGVLARVAEHALGRGVELGHEARDVDHDHRVERRREHRDLRASLAADRLGGAHASMNSPIRVPSAASPRASPAPACGSRVRKARSRRDSCRATTGKATPSRRPAAAAASARMKLSRRDGIGQEERTAAAPGLAREALPGLPGEPACSVLELRYVSLPAPSTSRRARASQRGPPTGVRPPSPAARRSP